MKSYTEKNLFKFQSENCGNNRPAKVHRTQEMFWLEQSKTDFYNSWKLEISLLVSSNLVDNKVHK